MTNINSTPKSPRPLELLAPAKNLECGIAAIDYGADAVYIGANRFGARAAAGNSVEDISQLCKYAHQYSAKVYVTVNTILYDNETEATQQLIQQLYEVGVDAILVQDMSVLEMTLPPIALHASTQTDNRTSERVKQLSALGFSRVVLARELSVEEIADIHHKQPNVELEVFVHGALCVSYSGICYASQYCFNRSANRGECAQFCRMKFDLVDADGNCLEHQRHLLSLKDLNQLDALDELAEAGATSFKIEGRLKDINYVKNVTAAYSEQLNKLVDQYPDLYCRASLGRCTYTFKPNLSKTFNRGFTHYFLHGRQPDIASFDTPKAMGEFVGNVKEIRGSSFNVAGTASFANGDGLCFINDEHQLEGFRVNRVEGNRIFTLKMPIHLRHGKALYRNNDQKLECILSKNGSKRKIDIILTLKEIEDGFELKLQIKQGLETTALLKTEKQKALKPQQENLIKQLSKLGNTPFACSKVILTCNNPKEQFNFFIPSSLLAKLRRQVVEEMLQLLEKRKEGIQRIAAGNSISMVNPLYPMQYLYNVSNKKAKHFYANHGLSGIANAFEIKRPPKPLIMQCRYCIRYALGYCVKHGGMTPKWKEPLYLRLGDGKRFNLKFDCKHCQMNIYADL